MLSSILLVVSSTVQKLLSLRFHLFIFAFVSLAWEDKSKKNSAKIYIKDCTAYACF